MNAFLRHHIQELHTFKNGLVFLAHPVVSVLCVVCKIEDELKKAISALEQRTGMRVRMNGKPYDVYIRQQWDEHSMKKELEKQQRVSVSKLLCPLCNMSHDNRRDMACVFKYVSQPSTAEAIVSFGPMGSPKIAERLNKYL